MIETPVLVGGALRSHVWKDLGTPNDLDLVVPSEWMWGTGHPTEKIDLIHLPPEDILYWLESTQIHICRVGLTFENEFIGCGKWDLHRKKVEVDWGAYDAALVKALRIWSELLVLTGDAKMGDALANITPDDPWVDVKEPQDTRIIEHLAKAQKRGPDVFELYFDILKERGLIGEDIALDHILEEYGEIFNQM